MHKKIGVVLILVGLTLGTVSVFTFQEAYQRVSSWRETNGEVLKSSVRTEHYRDRNRKRNQIRTRYRPVITVQYAAAGRTLQADLKPASVYSDHSEAEQATPNAGERIPVYFNPTNPTEAELNVGWNFDTFMTPFLTGLFALIATICGAALSRLQQAPTPA
jgi:hypothetical protein